MYNAWAIPLRFCFHIYQSEETVMQWAIADYSIDLVYLLDTFGKRFFHRHASHSLIRGVTMQRCSAGAKNFTKYVFFHVQFNGLVKNSQNHCAISVKFLKNDFLLYKID